MRVTQRNRTLHRVLTVVPSGVLAMLAWSCAVSRTTVTRPPGAPIPRLVATKQDLIARYNHQAELVTSLNASVTMTLTAGSAYTGVIKQYHEINGFILAQKPASLRAIGQAPVVGTNIFDMVSNGETFRIFIPSQHKFITGPTNLQRQSAKPIENLRPQHLTGAMFWEEVPEHVPVLIEEAVDETSRYYVLTVVRVADQSVSAAPETAAEWEIAQRIWFDRADLTIARVETYEPGGKLGSDVSYRAWNVFGTVNYPRQISLSRPDNDYKLQIGIKKVTFNEPISSERFVLQQPPGTELVNAGQESQAAKPEERKP